MYVVNIDCKIIPAEEKQFVKSAQTVETLKKIGRRQFMMRVIGKIFDHQVSSIEGAKMGSRKDLGS